ncbi:MAG: 1-deoxy-D-xylulose-5-phosphate reductoisomerase [Chloroflexi bacterium]|nr:1-deoxy-D-xylulose-5-phosphate reductoisomerase [Chloroflexota bacterium]
MAVTRLAILGATGSIGRQALEVVRAHPDALRVTALSGRSRAAEVARIARDFGVARVATGDADLAALATAPDVDLVLVATPGVAGLVPTLAALEAGKSVALANKEVLVVGGHLVRAAAGGAGERLRPVDSEHSGLWQCLAGERADEVKRVVLTASGGPLRDLPAASLGAVTPEEALRHPTWSMGTKVTLDSATLVNKAYEVIEAHWLYGLPYDRIDVLLHPQSIVHALVEFADGSVKAQLGAPDMRVPIQYALLGERHRPGPGSSLDLAAAGRLDFRALDRGRYPCFGVVLDAARSGAGAVIGVSAADEAAIERFLAGELPFDAIPELLRRGADLGARAVTDAAPPLAAILRADNEIRARLGAPVGVG